MPVVPISISRSVLASRLPTPYLPFSWTAHPIPHRKPSHPLSFTSMPLAILTPKQLCHFGSLGSICSLSPHPHGPIQAGLLQMPLAVLSLLPTITTFSSTFFLSDYVLLVIYHWHPVVWIFCSSQSVSFPSPASFPFLVSSVTGDQTQGLRHTRPVFYLWATVSAPKVLLDWVSSGTWPFEVSFLPSFLSVWEE